MDFNVASFAIVKNCKHPECQPEGLLSYHTSPCGYLCNHYTDDYTGYFLKCPSTNLCVGVVCVYVHTCMHVDARGWCGAFFHSSPYFWDRVTLTEPGAHCVARKHLFPSQCWATGMSHHALPFMWVLGAQPQILTLVQQALCSWNLQPPRY